MLPPPQLTWKPAMPVSLVGNMMMHNEMPREQNRAIHHGSRAIGGATKET